VQSSYTERPYEEVKKVKVLFKKRMHMENRGRFEGVLYITFLIGVIVMIYGSNTLLAQTTNTDSTSREQSNPQEYTLTELYKIALKRSEKVQISEEDLVIAKSEKERARSAYLPTISAFADYTRYTEAKLSDTPFGSFAIQPDFSAAWGLRLDETLSLSGREFTAYNISKMGIETSRYDLYAVMEDYLLTVAESYYDVLKAHKAIEIATSNVERLTEHRDAAEIRLRVGDVTKTALLRAEAELSGAQAKLVEAKNFLNLSKAVLARIVGLEGDFTVRESVPVDVKAVELHFLKQEAFAERVELKSSTIQKQMAKDEIRYKKGAYWPTLSLEGVYARMDEDPSSPFFLKESIYGILRVNFPFYEGGSRKAEVKQAEAKYKQSELMYEDWKKNISIEVEDAYLDLETQKGILESLEDQVAFAKENYNAISKQFDFGLAHSVDVMDANTSLVEAQIDFYRAQYDYQLSIIRLKRATGTLLKTVIDIDTDAE
jgi:outer membrane protein